MWEVVSMSLQAQGGDVAQGLGVNKSSPFFWACIHLFDALGGSYLALVLVQLPLLILLLASIGAVAWRVGGPFAGAAAPWLALFAPATIGLAVGLDDLLMVQALVAASLALLYWSDRPGLSALALASAVPVALLARSCFSSIDLLAVGTFCVAACALLLCRWAAWKKHGGGGPAAGPGSLVWQAIGVMIAAALGFKLIPVIHHAYIVEEMQRHDLPGVLARPIGLLAYPAVWARMQAGPILAAASAIGAVVLIARRKVLDAAPILAWLLGPIIGLGLLSKRNDYYIIAALPATYVLASAGLASINSARVRWVAAVILLVSLAGSWAAAMSGRRPWVTINPWGALQEDSDQYLVSPMRPPSQDRALAEWFSEKCSSSKGRLYIVNYAWNTHLLFFSWRANPGSRPGELFLGPDIDDERPCLAVHLPKIASRPISLEEALSMVIEEAGRMDNLSDPEVVDRLDHMLKKSEGYRFLEAKEDWAIFINADGE